MTFPGSFCLIIAFALQASRACRLPLWQSLETPLTPAAALAFFPRSAARKDVYEGAKYTMFLTLPDTTSKPELHSSERELEKLTTVDHPVHHFADGSQPG